MEKRKRGKLTEAQKLKYYPERKKGSLRPAGSCGKGDADSRCTDFEQRRQALERIFGVKCMKCYNNTKERTEDGQYYCPTCERRFTAL